MQEYNIIIFLVFSQICLYYFFRKRFIREIIKLKLVDKPAKNKIHNSNIPLTGGIILFFSLLTYILVGFVLMKYINPNFKIINDQIIIFFIGFSFAFFIGFVDDMLNFKIEKKIVSLIIFNILLFQQIAFFKTTVLIIDNSFLSLQINTFSISLILSIFFFLAYHHALAILDGINGIFGSYAIIFLFILLMFFKMNIFLSNFIFYTLLILIFLTILNFKNELFFGNSGSLLVSALIPYLILYFYNQRENSIDIFGYLSLVIIPILDMIRLFFIRLFKKQSPFNKDLNHFHHLLLKKYSIHSCVLIYLCLCFVPFILNRFLAVNFVILVICQILAFFYTCNRIKA